VLGLAAITAVVFGAASLLKDHSRVARAILWREADTDDYLRFPWRPIEAPPDPARFERDPVDLDDFRVAGRPLSELLGSSDTTAFIVLRGDTLIYERYFDGNDRRSIQTSFSVAKSFGSALLGIALRDGAIRKHQGSDHGLPTTDSGGGSSPAAPSWRAATSASSSTSTRATMSSSPASDRATARSTGRLSSPSWRGRFTNRLHGIAGPPPANWCTRSRER
jgi:hypothetical protein